MALPLVACGDGAGTPEAGREILVLGVMGTVNSEKPIVAGMVQGVELAVSEYNADPDSRYEIELKQFDTDSTAGEGGQGESEIVNTDRLVGVVGPFDGEKLAELSPVFETSALHYVVPSVADPTIPQRRVRFRRLIANREREGAVLAAVAGRMVSGDIVLVTERSGAGEPFSSGAREALDLLERPPSRVEAIAAGTTPSTLASVIAESPPDAVLYGGGAQTGKALLDSLRQAGFNGLLIGSHQIRDSHPDGLGEGVLSAAASADPQDPLVAGFTRAYRERFDADPTPFALEAHEGALMLLEGVEEVRGFPRSVTELLNQNRQFRGIGKYYQFDEQGEPVDAPVWIYESTGSGWTLLGRSDRVGS